MRTPKDIKDELRGLIDYMFTSKLPGIELQKCPVIAITEILKEYGYAEDEGSFNTNGWQVDWWQSYTHKEKPRLTLGGDVYYDYYCKLYVDEEDIIEEGN